MTDDQKDELEALKTYIDGKIKRYNLLFAVNGGAFAIVKLIVEKPCPTLNKLTTGELAVGAIAFTFLMWFDIWLWGESMRKGYFGGKKVFQWRGKTILSLLASLLIIGWLLTVCEIKSVILAFTLLLTIGTLLLYHQAKDGEVDENMS